MELTQPLLPLQDTSQDIPQDQRLFMQINDLTSDKHCLFSFSIAMCNQCFFFVVVFFEHNRIPSGKKAMTGMQVVTASKCLPITDGVCVCVCVCVAVTTLRNMLRWVKAGSGYGQALLRLLTTESLWCILKA